MNCQRLRVVFAGTPAFAARALEALLASDHEVVGVLSQPDRPAGRGRKLTASPVKELALVHALPVLQPVSLRDTDAVEAVAALQPDVIVVAAYGLILPTDVLTLPQLGCVNIHASLLPRWRGAAPIQRAILSGDSTTGITIMRMDRGLDTGDMISTYPLPIGAEDTSASLHDRLAVLGGESLVESLSPYCRGELVPEPQPETGVNYADKLHKQEAPLDFSLPAAMLDRQIRAFNPWPVAETRLGGERIRVWRSRLPAAATEPQSGSGSGSVSDVVRAPAGAGTVLSISGDTVEVDTGDGTLVLLEAQRDGGKRMSAGALLRSLDAVGKRLGA